jgi:ABC-type glycerol-3-phosphate transport system permease component
MTADTRADTRIHNRLDHRNDRTHAAVSTSRLVRRTTLYIVLITVTVILTSPFAWLILTALKSPAEMSAYPVQWVPETPRWDNFATAFTHIDFLGYARNSLIIAGIYSVLVTLSSAWVGYGFARLSAPGKRFWFGLLMATMMLPGIVTLIPTYLIFAKAGLVDTYIPWVLWGASGAAYLIFLFRQFFSGMPKELEEAAVLDGCGHVRIFCRIFLPQAWPVLAASLVLSFTWSWGDFLAPSLLLSADRTTLAVALTQGYVNPQGMPLNNLVAAGSTMYVLPVLVLFLFAQRKFVAGFSTTGMK